MPRGVADSTIRPGGIAGPVRPLPRPTMALLSVPRVRHLLCLPATFSPLLTIRELRAYPSLDLAINYLISPSCMLQDGSTDGYCRLPSTFLGIH